MRTRIVHLTSLLRFASGAIMLWLLLPTNVAAHDILELKISAFQVKNATMEEALTKLHSWGIQVCLEKVPRQSQEEDVRFSVSLVNAPVREVLDALVSADGRYTWERYQRSYVNTALINVLPLGAKTNSENLMNIKAKKVVIDGKNLPENRIAAISYFVPELNAKLYPGGVAGSMAGAVTGGNVTVSISFEFRDMTVREILNEMVLRTEGEGWVYEHVKAAAQPHRWRVLGRR